MGGINTSANQIGKIIGVFDGIAFLTNLLALHAGVEAARAGDHGRGFAVVASEVRALAQRTAEAAKEVKALIARSSQQVGEGSRLVEEIGEEVSALLANMTEIGTAVAAGIEGGGDVTRRLQRLDGAVKGAAQSARETVSLASGTSAAIAALSDGLAALSSDAERLAGTPNVTSLPAVLQPTASAHRQQSPVSRPVASDRAVRPGPEQIKRMRRSIPVVDGAAARSLVDHPEGGEG
jgi:methyl-accepting chemotaxis protein